MENNDSSTYAPSALGLTFCTASYWEHLRVYYNTDHVKGLCPNCSLQVKCGRPGGR